MEVGVAETAIQDTLDARCLHQATKGFQMPEADVVEHVEEHVGCPFWRLDRHGPGFFRIVDGLAHLAGKFVFKSVGNKV